MFSCRASVRASCCFGDFCGMHRWIFTKLLSVVHPGIEMNLIRFWVTRLKVRVTE